jgi:hypothetical protein
MGRLVKTRQKIAESSERSLRKPLSMWILANPRGDLDIAGSEGMKIFQDMARLNQEEEIIAPCLDADVTADDVREQIKSYDFVHFAGHSTYSSLSDHNGPGKSGWKLADGTFTVRHIDRMASGAAMPAFVFSNACQSARTQAWEWKENSEDGSFGLANAFLRAGVKHYLGTFWEVMDEPSSHFAHEFYGLLSSGVSVGDAVRQARCNLMETYGPDTCWASYILYGDPRTGYFSQEPRAVKQIPPEPAISRSTRTRGALFNYNFNTGKLKELRTWAGVLLVILAAVFGAVAGNAVLENFSMNQGLRIRQLLTEQAEKKQKRTEELFRELAKTTDLGAREQNPDAMTLAMVFDSRASLSDQKTENLAAFAIQSQLIEQSRFKILERKSFDTVLQEIIWDRPEQPDLLMPRLLLFLEVYDDGDQSLVLMRLVDKNTGAVIENLFEEIDTSRPVFAQKNELSENLLKRLKSRYPLRGLISEIRENEVGLNIGDEAGVRPGQWFKVIGKDVFLKITSVQAGTAAAQIAKGNSPLEEGLQVEAI